jgi:hypothetical protein
MWRGCARILSWLGRYTSHFDFVAVCSSNWLHTYLICQVSNPSPASIASGRAQIFSRAYQRIMPEIQNALDDFHNNPYDDPSNMAFYVRHAASQKSAISTCVGGCQGNAYMIPINSINQTLIVSAYTTHILQLQGRVSGKMAIIQISPPYCDLYSGQNDNPFLL